MCRQLQTQLSISQMLHRAAFFVDTATQSAGVEVHINSGAQASHYH